MKTSRYLVPIVAAASVLAIILTGAVDTSDLLAQQPRSHSISITKVGTQWKVVSATGDTVKAKPGELIVWTAVGTDAYFQFMDDKIFGNYTRMVKAGQKLTLPVGAAARKGVHAYAVFCLTDKQFARGDSPPIIIIE